MLQGKLKNILWGVFAVVLAVVFAVMFFDSDLEHIEDTNGPDNFDLQVITEENIIDRDLGSIGGPKISKSILTGDTITFSAEKYTGVSEILYDNFILPSDFDLSLTSFEVYEGNLKLLVIHNDEIAAELQPDMFVDYRLEDIKGTVSLRIAGESASFQFYISQHEYDRHSHP